MEQDDINQAQRKAVSGEEEVRNGRVREGVRLLCEAANLYQANARRTTNPQSRRSLEHLASAHHLRACVCAKLSQLPAPPALNPHDLADAHNNDSNSAPTRRTPVTLAVLLSKPDLARREDETPAQHVRRLCDHVRAEVRGKQLTLIPVPSAFSLQPPQRSCLDAKHHDPCPLQPEKAQPKQQDEQQPPRPAEKLQHEQQPKQQPDQRVPQKEGKPAAHAGRERPRDADAMPQVMLDSVYAQMAQLHEHHFGGEEGVPSSPFERTQSALNLSESIILARTAMSKDGAAHVSSGQAAYTSFVEAINTFRGRVREIHDRARSKSHQGKQHAAGAKEAPSGEGLGQGAATPQRSAAAEVTPQERNMPPPVRPSDSDKRKPPPQAFPSDPKSLQLEFNKMAKIVLALRKQEAADAATIAALKQQVHTLRRENHQLVHAVNELDGKLQTCVLVWEEEMKKFAKRSEDLAKLEQASNLSLEELQQCMRLAAQQAEPGAEVDPSAKVAALTAQLTHANQHIQDLEQRLRTAEWAAQQRRAEVEAEAGDRSSAGSLGNSLWGFAQGWGLS